MSAGRFCDAPLRRGPARLRARAPELGDIADFDRLPIRLSEVRQLLINRDRPSSAPRTQCSRDRFLERLALGLDKHRRKLPRVSV